MDFSGERVIPGRVEDVLWAEHLARYSLAAQMVQENQSVLDYACGTGYGSAVLKRVGAGHVVGVDRSIAAIDYARHRYGAEDLNFLVTDCLTAGLASGTFDLVVSFEAIEHMNSPKRFLQEIGRILRPNGHLLLSTPNKRTYTDERPVERNPFHLHEFYRQQLLQLLRESFSLVTLYGQSIAEGNVFTDLAAADTDRREIQDLSIFDISARDSVKNHQDDFDFFIAYCRKGPPEQEDPVRRNYFFTSNTNEIRQKRNRIIELQEELEERTLWAQELDRAVKHLRSRLQDGSDSGIDALLAKHHAELQDREKRIRALSQRIRDLHSDLMDLDAWWFEQIESLDTDSRESGLLTKDKKARVAFIQSGNPDDARKCLDVLLEKVHPGTPVVYITHSAEVIPRLQNLPEGSEVLVTEPHVGQLLALTGFLRHRSFIGQVALLSGEKGYLRFKTLALCLAGRRLVIFNENGDCFFFSVSGLLRHIRWRLGQKIESVKVIRLFRATIRTLRQQGIREVLSKVRARQIVHRRHRVKGRWLRRFRKSKPLEFPEFQNPDLSVVIPVHNHTRVTYECLESIVKNGGDVRYEVIVVDDASGPKMVNMLNRQLNLRTVRLDANRGFVGACNAGAEAARGRVIFFLNNDTLLISGTFEALLKTFEDHPECGAVGAKLLFPDGTLQEAGGIVWRNGVAWNYGRHDDPQKPDFNYLREVDYCSGAALAVLRSVFLDVGGFDPLFAPGYYEDTDLCFRLRAAGYRVLYQPLAVVIHLDGVSSRGRGEQGMKSYQVVNQKKFHERWRKELKQQERLHPTRLYKARDRRRGELILAFDHYVPTPDKDAGSLVMFSMLKALSAAGHRVIFWPDNLFQSPGYTQRLQQLGVEVIYGPASYEEFVRNRGESIDIAFAYRAKIADKYLPRLSGLVPRRIYLCVDLEHLRETRRRKLEKRLGTFSDDEGDLVERLEEREFQLIRKVDQVAVHSSVEQKILQKRFPDTEIFLLPLPVRPGRLTELDHEHRRDLLFVGSSHPPNVDAVTFYHQELGTLIRRVLKDVQLIVVGEVTKTIPRKIRNSPGIHFTGFVPCIEDYYENSRVYLAPLRYGAGIKGKILEAMSYGIPVVTTTVGAEGIPIKHGVSGFIADDAEEIAEAVVRLYQDPELWQSVRCNAREIIENQYSPEKFQRQVHRLVTQKN